MIVTLFILLIFTLSREGWLGFIFMFIYISYTFVKYNIVPHIKRNIGIIIALIFLLVSINYNIIYHRIIEYTFGGRGWEYLYEASSSKARFILWDASLKAISKNWLLGTGPVGYSIVQELVPWYFITGGDPHNSFLRLFLENGIIGFITFLFFIKKLFDFRKLCLNYSFELYKYAIVAGTIGLIFSGILGDSFQDFEPMVLLLTIVALLENLRGRC
ncbi:MAG: O-antigen ligase family protein [Candidatus Methanomethylicaceae archaeon]